MSKNVKLVTFVPMSHADDVREAMGKAGAGKVGNYIFNSFSIKGNGRFKPLSGAKPVVGKIGKLEKVKEVRIECVCERIIAKKVLESIRSAHPYEEVVIDIYPLISEDEL